MPEPDAPRRITPTGAVFVRSRARMGQVAANRHLWGHNLRRTLVFLRRGKSGCDCWGPMSLGSLHLGGDVAFTKATPLIGIPAVRADLASGSTPTEQ